MRTNRILRRFEAMESRVKTLVRTLGVAVPVALCAALLAWPGHAQKAAPKAGASGAGASGVAASSVRGGDLHRPSVQLNTVPTYGTGLNGSTMGRITTGPGYIGGPAKDRSGINGTAIRPKR